MAAWTSAIDRVRAAHHWAILPSGNAAAVGEHVARLVATGARGLVVPQIFAPPWATLGAAATACELDLASGIALGFVRSPMETAMAALDLDRLCGGRLTLGLGSSTQIANEDRFGVPYDKPVSRLRELTELVHRMVTADEQGAIGRFEGEFWHVDLTGVRLPRPVRPTIPIYLAPLRATMTEMAAEVADGIFGHPVWSPSWITGEVRAAVDRGLATAGRARVRLPGHGVAARRHHRRSRPGGARRQGRHPVLRQPAPVRVVLRRHRGRERRSRPDGLGRVRRLARRPRRRRLRRPRRGAGARRYARGGGRADRARCWTSPTSCCSRRPTDCRASARAPTRRRSPSTSCPVRGDQGLTRYEVRRMASHGRRPQASNLPVAIARHWLARP